MLTRRRHAGDPLAPEAIAHYIETEGEIALACETRAAPGGGLEMRGLCVAEGADWRTV